MDKSKAEDFKFTIKKATDMKENGKVIFQMGKGKLHIGQVLIILESLNKVLNMEKDNSMTLKIKKYFNKFMKMVFWLNKKSKKSQCQKINNFQLWFLINSVLIVRICTIFKKRTLKSNN